MSYGRIRRVRAEMYEQFEMGGLERVLSVEVDNGTARLTILIVEEGADDEGESGGES